MNKKQSKANQKPHSMLIRFLGNGMGTATIYYYGDEMPPGIPVKDLSNVRFIK